MQDLGYKRLAIALCASIMLHLLLVGQLYLKLPNAKLNLQAIEARILIPAVKKKLAEAPPLPNPIPETSSKPEPKPLKSKSPIPIPVKPPELDSAQSDAASTTTSEVIPPDLMGPNNITPPNSAPSDANNSPPQTDSIPESSDSPPHVDEGLVINESAYQYVETVFNVSTKIGGSPEGLATMTFNLLDATHYQITSVAKARGLAALVLSELLQTSEGMLTKTGLQPNQYTYNYGDKASKTRLAKFDWQAKTVSMQTAKGTQSEPLPDAAQDLLSFMYQFMYVPPLHTMQISIVNAKSLHTYDYNFEGEETTALPMGELKTVHIQHSNAETEDKIDLWLALDYQYLPVKIVKVDKNGKIYELTAVNLKTVPNLKTLPVAPNPSINKLNFQISTP